MLRLLPVLAIAAATGGIHRSTPSQVAVADIPPDYLMLYQEAGLAFDVPWESNVNAKQWIGYIAVALATSWLTTKLDDLIERRFATPNHY